MTVRDITFFDKADEEWEDEQRGVLVEQVKSGGWAALGRLTKGALIVEVDERPVSNVDALTSIMEELETSQPKAVVIKVLRGIHSSFIELEPKWDAASEG